MTVNIRKAVKDDKVSIARMIERAGLLNRESLPDVENFLIAETVDENIVATIGLEKYGDFGLLRTFVMDTNYWDAKKMMQFFQVVFDYGVKQDLKGLYLLTKRPSFIFQAFGFQTISQTEIPTEMLRSSAVEKAIMNKSVIMFKSL
ncbi:hypothetical protein [Pseudalkalibacillus caeni]|uniref:N-acetyltransferase domain-containing protein n=1 Tax=Exobacillus caeni TaxID=2574798 RepID=A0A5R9EZP5_9BACL|nr:hypothetical protein [Pseudalkalibacillus caeni]TLS36707.1 hypothetical protein FCL54_14425 [Pseudalkalibacillus caeni]